MSAPDAARPLGCPAWCEMDAGQHEPAWHAGALRIDHQRLYRVEGAGVVCINVEAMYVPEGETLRLTLGPVRVSVEPAGDDMDAGQARALGQALTDAAALVDAAEEQQQQ